MKKYLFIYILCVAIGGYFSLTADTSMGDGNEAFSIALSQHQGAADSKQDGINKTHSAQMKKCCGPKKIDSCNPCCSCQYVIPSKEINKGKGFVIDRPGVWCLDGNVHFNPKPSKYAPPDPRAVQAAITVKAGVSNVIIDLGSYRIEQRGAGTTTQTPYVIGILVPDPAPTSTDPNFVGAQSIYIQGDQAIIDGFSMFGIRIFGHTRDIRLSNMTIKNCGGLASLALRPFPDYFPHGTRLTSYGPPMAVAGLAIGEADAWGFGPTFFTQAENLPSNRVESVVIENVSSIDNFFGNIFLVNSTNNTITDCHFDHASSDDPGNATGPNGPYNVVSAVNARFVGSIANENPGLLNTVVSNTTFNNATLRGNGISSFDYTSTIFTAGDDQTSGSNYVGNPCVGLFNSRSKNITFNDCQFNGHTNLFLGDVTTMGIGSGGDEDATYMNCHFDGITTLGSINGFHTSGGGAGTASQQTKSNRNTLLVNCTSNNHRCIGDQALPAPLLTANGISGFFCNFSKDLTMEGCVSQDLVNSSPTSIALNCNGFTISDTRGSTPPAPDATIRNFVMENCIASRVQTLCGGNVAGFGVTVPASNEALNSLSMEQCDATGNQTFPSGLAPLYSATITYSLGATSSFNNVNYISLVNSNLGNTPSTSPSQWGITTANVLPWNNTTNYPATTAVTYLSVLYVANVAVTSGGPVPLANANWTPLSINPPAWNSTTSYSIGAPVFYQGYDWYSLTNLNVGNAPGTRVNNAQSWLLYPGSVLRPWNSTTGYNTGSIVSAAGINYISLTGGTTGGNIGNQPDPTGVNLTNWTPYNTGIAQGVGCGYQIFQENNPVTLDVLESFPVSLCRCKAMHNKGLPTANNVYSAGIYLQNGVRSEIFECETEDNVYGILFKQCDRDAIRNCRSDNNIDLQYVLSNPGGTPIIGEGYTDIGNGTPASPTKSTSIWESNRAFGNGQLVHVGPNGNYNIWMDAALTLRPPLLRGQASTASYIFTDPSATYFSNVHNNSIIP